MNRRQRKAKQRRAREHSQHKFDAKGHALYEATHIAKNGSKLKNPRTGVALAKAMEERGYVSNGKGGWRLLIKRSTVSTIDKEI